MTPSSFYHQYRSHLINHAARRGETIQWKNNEVLAQDEQFGPSYEDHILYSVIEKIDERLLEFIHVHYQLKLTQGQRLMDVRADIQRNIPEYLETAGWSVGINDHSIPPDSCNTQPGLVHRSTAYAATKYGIQHSS